MDYKREIETKNLKSVLHNLIDKIDDKNYLLRLYNLAIYLYSKK